MAHSNTPKNNHLSGPRAIEILYEYILQKGFSPHEAVQQLYIEELKLLHNQISPLDKTSID